MEAILDPRAHLVLGTVLSVNDGGAVQTVTVRTHTGFVRSDLEVLQPFGFASMPPLDGAIVALLAIGGDPGHYMALPVAAPSRRFGGQAPGEAAMYAYDGTRVAVRSGGRVEVWGATSVTIHTKDVAITASGTVTVTAPHTVVNGDAHVTGDVSDGHGSLSGLRAHYNAHRHGGSTTTDQPD